MMTQEALKVVRIGPASFAGVLGLAAAWMLLVDLVQPTLPFFPDDAATAQAAAGHRSSAGVAAWIGLVRGDLWTGYAIALAPDLTWQISEKGPGASLEALDSARVAALRAAALAPTDARTWLLVAAVDFQRGSQNASGPLKMSYYTGPNELSLIPLRIQIATRSAA